VVRPPDHENVVFRRQILALHGWRESSLFASPERAALDYAEAMTYTVGKITDALSAELKKHFDDDAIVELTGLIAFQNMSSKFNAALDIPPQGFCHVPNLATDKREHEA